MKANVQHHDFIGSAAADISDHTDLQEFLRTKGVDTTRYEAVGAGFYDGSEEPFSGFIICKDNQKTTEERDHLIRLTFEKEITKDEFFSLFRRFVVLIASKRSRYEITEVSGELVVSKSEQDTVS